MGYRSETVDVGVTQKELQWLCLHVEKKGHYVDYKMCHEEILDAWQNITGLFIDTSHDCCTCN